MELMKQRLCFRITAKMGNSKRQHCSQQEKKIEWGPLFEEKKNPRRKRKEEGKTEKKKCLYFCSHMNRKSTSYAQGAKC